MAYSGSMRSPITYWHIHRQPRSAWTQEVDLRPFQGNVLRRGRSQGLKETYMGKLEGKIELVTGGNSSIGLGPSGKNGTN